MSRPLSSYIAFYGVFAALFVLVGYGVPLHYDRTAEVPALVRQAALTSAELDRDCGEPKDFFLVPWHLSLHDDDSRGTVSLRYEFSCRGAAGTIDAKFTHSGADWSAEKIEARVGQRTYMLGLPARTQR